MRRKLLALSLAGSLLTPALTFASAYRIPEQSLNSVALSAAYVAHTEGADTSYFNPANMSWQQEGWHSSLSLTYINLPSVDYTDATNQAFNGGSKTENFFLPQVHMVSPDYNNFRFGLSFVIPAGLSKRWDAAYPMATAEEFTLKVYELNPNVSYKINDMISLGAGFRAVYADGTVKSYSSAASRDMDGDTTEYGYNLALTVKPVSSLTVAATYRSKIDLDIEGDAILNVGGIPYRGGANVSVPLPAVLTFGAAYTFGKSTIELVYDKTFWDAYDKLDFNYDTALTFPLSLFDTAIPKNWTNTDSYRIGFTYQVDDKLKLMAGFAIDKTPAPDETLGFELPDSDALIYSIGGQYKKSKNLDFGIAYLYDHKEDRTVANRSLTAPTAPNGTFSGNGAHLLTVAMEYRF